MKEAISYRIEHAVDTTNILMDSVKKSLNHQQKKARKLKGTISDMVDIDDITKSLHKVIHPEIHAERRSSIIHPPIDLSKFPASAYRRGSDDTAFRRASDDSEIRRTSAITTTLSENSNDDSTPVVSCKVTSGVVRENIHLSVDEGGLFGGSSGYNPRQCTMGGMDNGNRGEGINSQSKTKANSRSKKHTTYYPHTTKSQAAQQQQKRARFCTKSSTKLGRRFGRAIDGYSNIYSGAKNLVKVAKIAKKMSK